MRLDMKISSKLKRATVRMSWSTGAKRAWGKWGKGREERDGVEGIRGGREWGKGREEGCVEGVEREGGREGGEGKDGEGVVRDNELSLFKGRIFTLRLMLIGEERG